MGLMEKLDLAILDGFFQKVADWVNDRWGKTHIWLTIISTWCVMILWCIEAAMKQSIGASILLALFSFLQITVTLPYKKKQEERMELRANRVMNPERLFWPLGLFRIIMGIVSAWGALTSLLILPVRIVDIVSAIESASFVAMFYFAACSSKPPNPLKAGNRLALSPTAAG